MKHQCAFPSSPPKCHRVSWIVDSSSSEEEPASSQPSPTSASSSQEKLCLAMVESFLSYSQECFPPASPVSKRQCSPCPTRPPTPDGRVSPLPLVPPSTPQGTYGLALSHLGSLVLWGLRLRWLRGQLLFPSRCLLPFPLLCLFLLPTFPCQQKDRFPI